MSFRDTLKELATTHDSQSSAKKRHLPMVFIYLFIMHLFPMFLFIYLIKIWVLVAVHAQRHHDVTISNLVSSGHITYSRHSVDLWCHNSSLSLNFVTKVLPQSLISITTSLSLCIFSFVTIIFIFLNHHYCYNSFNVSQLWCCNSSFTSHLCCYNASIISYIGCYSSFFIAHLITNISIIYVVTALKFISVCHCSIMLWREVSTYFNYAYVRRSRLNYLFSRKNS